MKRTCSRFSTRRVSAVPRPGPGKLPRSSIHGFWVTLNHACWILERVAALISGFVPHPH